MVLKIFFQKKYGPEHSRFISEKNPELFLIPQNFFFKFFPHQICAAARKNRTCLPGVMPKGGLGPRKSFKMPGLPKWAFLENPIKRPDSIGSIFKVKTLNGAHFGSFMIWVDFPFGKGGPTQRTGVGKKGPPNRNTVYQNALYASQFTGILAIGACHGAFSPSERVFADGSGRVMDMGQVGGDPGVPGISGKIQKNFKEIFRNFLFEFSPEKCSRIFPGRIVQKIFRSAGIF
jgi:hypothetical protein